ncbi:MAG: hypothetical protein KF690_02080 [Bacteroidetes bacterium]|nr:hypothetical protein [Bacteroidota bacterium]
MKTPLSLPVSRLFLGIGVLLSSLLFCASRCHQAKPDNNLWGAWRHAYEETRADGARSYRPRQHELPPSRGRHWFEIRQDGTFIDHPIAPADGSLDEPGTWKAVSPTELAVTLKTGRTFRIRIHELTPEQLWLTFE